MAVMKPRTLESASIVLFSTMMLANILNYAYQIAMGNMLSVQEYGALNALLALSTIASVPSGAFLMTASRTVAQHMANTMGDTFSRLNTTYACSIVLGVLFVVLGFALSVPIANLLGLDSIASVIVTMLFVGLNCVYPVLSGVLQGSRRFLEYGLSSVISMLSKLVFALIFVACGLGLIGALAGLALSPVCAGIFCYLRIYDYVHIRAAFGEARELRSVLNAFQGLLIAQILLAIVTNGDAILVKMLFDPEIAGIYSSAMVLAKIPMYAASAIVAALFPLAASATTDNEYSIKLFVKSLLYGGGIAIASSMLLILFGQQIVQLFFNDNYLSATNYLPAIAVLSVSITLITILLNYVAALDNLRSFNIICGAGCIIGYLIVIASHAHIDDVVLILTITNFVVFSVCLVVLLAQFKKIA